jgi:hypothetical protein
MKLIKLIIDKVDFVDKLEWHPKRDVTLY